VYGLILGKRYQGKSTLALSIACSLSSTVVIWDPNSQFLEVPLVSIESLEGRFDEVAGGELGRLTVRVTRDDYEEAFQELADQLWNWEDYCLIVDEAATVQKPSWIHPGLKRAITRGPASVSVIQTAHRMSDFHRMSQAQATDVFFFRSTQARDVERIADEFDPRLEAVLPQLGRYEVAHYWLDPVGGIEHLAVWRKPRDWFIEIGRRDGKPEELAG
jgi:hypothetical protein